MKKFSIVSFALAGLICLTCLSGCGKDAAEVGLVTASNGGIRGDGALQDFNGMSDSADRAEQAAVYDDARHEVAGASVAGIERKVIRNATLSLETESGRDTSELYALLVAHCDSLGGYEFSCDVNNSEMYSSVSAVLKIPPEKLDEFTAYIGESAKILHSRVDSDDVTDEFYDLETRLDTKRRALESYYALLKDAADTNEIIQIQRTIDSITEDIEAAEGRLRVLSELVGMATVSLSIFQENDPARRDVEWGALSAGDMGYYIKNGFIGVISTVWGIIQWLAIILISTCPLWIPLTIILIFVIRRQKAKKAKRIAEIRETETKYKRYNKENQDEVPQEAQENQERREENE